MTEVRANGTSGDGNLGFEPTNATSEGVDRQTQEGSQGLPDGMALPTGRTHLASLHLRALDGVVQNEDAVVEGDMGSGRGPEGGRIGLES